MAIQYIQQMYTLSVPKQTNFQIVLSQNVLSLIKFIEKTNIYNIKLVSLDRYIFIVYLFAVNDVVTLSYKICQT